MSKQEIAGLLAKARRSIKAAEGLLQAGDYDFSISRAYYWRLSTMAMSLGEPHIAAGDP